MRAIDKVLLVQQMEKQSFAKEVANLGTYFIPGVGTARSGYDALKAFRGGKWLSGLGSLAIAGASLMPGVGGVAAGIGKGLSKLPGIARLAKATPTLSGGVKALGSGVFRGGEAMNQGFRSTLSAVPSLRGIGQAAMKRPGITGAGLTGAAVGLPMMQAADDAARAAQSQQGIDLARMFQNYAGSRRFQNPIWAAPGGF